MYVVLTVEHTVQHFNTAKETPDGFLTLNSWQLEPPVLQYALFFVRNILRRLFGNSPHNDYLV